MFIFVGQSLNYNNMLTEKSHIIFLHFFIEGAYNSSPHFVTLGWKSHNDEKTSGKADQSLVGSG